MYYFCLCWHLVNIKKRCRCSHISIYSTSNLCFEISKGDRRKKGSSQEGEKVRRLERWGKGNGRKKRLQNGKKKGFITFGAQRTLFLTDRSCSGSNDYCCVLGMHMWCETKEEMFIWFKLLEHCWCCPCLCRWSVLKSIPTLCILQYWKCLIELFSLKSPLACFHQE